MRIIKFSLLILLSIEKNLKSVESYGNNNMVTNNSPTIFPRQSRKKHYIQELEDNNKIIQYCKNSVKQINSEKFLPLLYMSSFNQQNLKEILSYLTCFDINELEKVSKLQGIKVIKTKQEQDIYKIIYKNISIKIEMIKNNPKIINYKEYKDNGVLIYHKEDNSILYKKNNSNTFNEELNFFDEEEKIDYKENPITDPSLLKTQYIITQKITVLKQFYNLILLLITYQNNHTSEYPAMIIFYDMKTKQLLYQTPEFEYNDFLIRYQNKSVKKYNIQKYENYINTDNRIISIKFFMEFLLDYLKEYIIINNLNNKNIVFNSNNLLTICGFLKQTFYKNFYDKIDFYSQQSIQSIKEDETDPTTSFIDAFNQRFSAMPFSKKNKLLLVNTLQKQFKEKNFSSESTDKILKIFFEKILKINYKEINNKIIIDIEMIEL